MAYQQLLGYMAVEWAKLNTQNLDCEFDAVTTTVSICQGHQDPPESSSYNKLLVCNAH